MLKHCPVCHLVNPPDAQRCDCGYDFEARQILNSYLTNKDLIRAAENEKSERDKYRFISFCFKFFRGFGRG